MRRQPNVVSMSRVGWGFGVQIQNIYLSSLLEDLVILNYVKTSVKIITTQMLSEVQCFIFQPMLIIQIFKKGCKILAF